MSTHSHSFSHRLTLRRDELAMSQKELAEKADIGTTILSKYERGISEPKRATLLKLAEALGCSAEWLEKGVVTATTEHFETISLPAPRDLLDRIVESAKESGRDPISEILFRLEESFEPNGSSHTTPEQISILAATLKDEMRSFKGEIKKEVNKAASAEIDRIIAEALGKVPPLIHETGSEKTKPFLAHPEIPLENFKKRALELEDFDIPSNSNIDDDLTVQYERLKKFADNNTGETHQYFLDEMTRIENEQEERNLASNIPTQQAIEGIEDEQSPVLGKRKIKARRGK